MTEKLYYQDSGMCAFTGWVLECNLAQGRYEIVLDRTAFYPEGGGQPGDEGYLGSARVFDVHARGDEVVHYCRSPLEVGSLVEGRIDWPLRFRRMQNHSGEHIVSGIIRRLYGFENVGFHMSGFEVTLDANGELDEEMLRRVERLANEAVWADVPINILHPQPEELKALDYRSKKELSGDVRLVEIPGYDLCACCGTHLARTGQIGQIRLISVMRHRGGARMTMVCGADALTLDVERAASVAAISALLSAKQDKVVEAVEKLKGDLDEAKATIGRLHRQRALELLNGLEPIQGSRCFFVKDMEADSLRALANGAAPLCGGAAAVFCENGDGWQYVIASTTLDLKKLSGSINAAILGRGGGSPGMIQGSAKASREELESYFAAFPGEGHI